MKTNANKLIVPMLIVVGLMVASLVNAQDAKSLIFKEADKSLKVAKEKNAEILSPSAFENGMKYYTDANNAFDSGDDLSEIKQNLQEAKAYFNESVKDISIAELLFIETLAAREDAISAKADVYQIELWNEAEEEFKDASRKLEKGKSEDAKEEAVEVTELYMHAELESIKSNLYNNAREMIEKAEDMKAEKIAPKTFAKAKQNLTDGENALNNDRYDTDRPRILAKEAKYEARHAIHIIEYTNSFNSEKKNIEDLFLEWETEMINIAYAAKVSVSFDQEATNATDEIIAEITNLQDSVAQKNHAIDNLRRICDNQKQQLDNLNSQIKLMDEEQSHKLADAAKYQKGLEEKMAYQNMIDSKFDEIYNLFDSDKAEVFRQENDIIMRMTGFKFDIGSSEIKPENFGLLTTVQKAINIFPDNNVVIEGHTDAQGSNKTNLELSQKRAGAVKSYLIANMPEYNESNILSAGYGEEKPIATNETKLGRAKNRRIDIVIKIDKF